MRVGAHPSALAPGQDPLDLEHDLRGVRPDLDDPPHGPDLEALRHLDVDLAQGQVDRGPPRYVRAIMDAGVEKVDAVVLEPRAVRDAVAVDGREVLTGLAVDVELDRHRAARPPLDHAELDAPRGRRHDLQGPRPARALELRNGNGLPAGQVKSRARVRGVLDKYFARGHLGEAVVVRGLPGLFRVDGAPGGRDHLPEVERDLLEEAPVVEVGPELDALRQPEERLPPRAPPEGRALGPAGRDPRDDECPLHGLEPEGYKGRLGARILPRPEPVHPGPVVGARDARLPVAPAGRELLVRRPHGARLPVGDRLEAVLAPAPPRGSHLVATADRHTLLFPVGVDEDVVGDMLAERAASAHGRDDAAGARVHLGLVRSMHEDEPLRLELRELRDGRLRAHHEHAPDLEGDTEAHAAARRRVAGVLRHCGRDAAPGELREGRVSLESDRPEVRRGRAVF